MRVSLTSEFIYNMSQFELARFFSLFFHFNKSKAFAVEAKQLGYFSFDLKNKSQLKDLHIHYGYDIENEEILIEESSIW